MTDLRHFEGKSTGYYSGTWVNDSGHVGGWIPKPILGPVESPADIPETWVLPPFLIFYWNLADVVTKAETRTDLSNLKAEK